VSRGVRVALLVLAFSPALLCGLLVAHYGTEVPIWDDLERATLLQRWIEGTLDWRYVYSPHIEHRMTVPRLITLASAALGDGSMRTELWVIFAIVVATALLVHGLLRQTFPGRAWLVFGLTFVANVLLFSPLQWETFLYPIQTSFVTPPFGLCLALFALNARLGYGAKFGLAFLGAVLATNSFSHGVLVWGVVFAAVALQQRFGTPRARLAFLGAWTLAAAAVLVPHFTVGGYVNTSDFAYVPVGERAPGLQLATLPERLPRALQFFAAILGSPLARTTVLDPRTLAPFAAALLLGAFALCALRALWTFWALRALRAGGAPGSRDATLWDRWLPWLAMGGYAVVASAAPAIGRSALLKWSYGLVPHYLTVSVYLLLADVVLLALLVEDLRARVHGPQAARMLSRAAAFAAGALLAFQALQWGIGVAGMREWQSARLQARTAMIFINHFEPEHIRRVGGDLEDPLKLVNRLDEAGFMVPPLLPDTRLCHFEMDPRPVGEADAFVKAVRVAGRSLVVEGWARLPGARRRADGILFTVPAAGGRRVIEAGELDGMPYVAVPSGDRRLNGVRIAGVEEFAGFRSKIPLEHLDPAAHGEIQVWVVDSEHMRVRPLAQHIALDEASGRLQAAVRGGPGRPPPAASAGCADAGR
jgi:hypothetical protein